jgi:glutathione S-transferase
MTNFTVYGVIGSPYVRAALLGLEEKGCEYRVHPLGMGEHKKAEHLARHPFGRIPVLDHGDFRLYETQAILRYLDRLVPDPPLTPTDARTEARMNQVIGVTDSYLMADFSGPIAFQRIVAPRSGLPTDEARLVAALPRAKICLDEVARLLGDKPYMAGAALSIADLIIAPQLVFAPLVEDVGPVMSQHPNLLAWIERMKTRPSMQATADEVVMARFQAA